MGYTAELKKLPECTIYCRQGVVSSFEMIEKFILESVEECRTANPKVTWHEESYCYTAYLDTEFKDSDLLIEYCQEVEEPGVETETVKFRKLAGTPAVCVRYKGAYKNLKTAYQFAFSWVTDLGFEISAPPREQYIHGIFDTDNSDEWVTEIQIPVHISGA